MGKKPLLLFLAASSIALSMALLLSACSKNSSSPTGPGSGAIITVTGKVIGIDNQPIASVPVLVTGLPSVNTDANGNFTIPNVTTPYSIIVVDGAHFRALVYRGLTRSDPTLFWLGASSGTSRNAAVSGNLVPVPGASTLAGTAFVSPDAAGNATANITTGAFLISSTWYGPATTTGSIYALVWQFDANNLPTTFTKFGKRSGVSLLNGTTNPNQNDTLGVAQSAQISGMVNVASGYTLTGRTLAAVFESKGEIQFLTDGSTVPSFTYVTPNVTGAGLTLEAGAKSAAGSTVVSIVSGLAVNASNVSITMPAAPEPSLPINNATNVTKGTPFSWTPYVGGVHILVFNPSAAGQPEVLVMTAAASDSIPDLTSAGLSFPKSATYTWNVDGVAPYASVDAASGPGGM